MGYCRFYFRHTRKEIDMKKCLIALLFLFSTVVLAKTWEANLRSCDGHWGFWFPNHNWTDKGEPWIKPFQEGKTLEDYNETGFSFNSEDPPGNNCDLTVERPFGMVWKSISLDKVDSVFLFEVNCKWDSTYVCDKELSLENLLIEDFYLLKINDDEFNLNYRIFYDIYHSCSYLTGLYFIYKKYSENFEYNALCNMMMYKTGCGYYSYAIQCEFQDDGTLNFNKIPDAKMVPENFCSTQLISLNRRKGFKQKKDFANFSIYKVNGTPDTKGSSNIIVKNKQSKLQLKGKR